MKHRVKPRWQGMLLNGTSTEEHEQDKHDWDGSSSSGGSIGVTLWC
jgi:hypothetical protein